MIIHKGLSPYHDIGILYSKLQSRQGCHFAIPDTNAHRMIGRVPVDQVSLSFSVRLITPIEVVEGIDPSFHFSFPPVAILVDNLGQADDE